MMVKTAKYSGYCLGTGSRLTQSKTYNCVVQLDRKQTLSDAIQGQKYLEEWIWSKSVEGIDTTAAGCDCNWVV